MVYIANGPLTFFQTVIFLQGLECFWGEKKDGSYVDPRHGSHSNVGQSPYEVRFVHGSKNDGGEEKNLETIEDELFYFLVCVSAQEHDA